MSWNYRIVEVDGGFELHEVYYDDDGKPEARTADYIIYGETVDEIREALLMMLRDIEKPVLNDDDIGE